MRCPDCNCKTEVVSTYFSRKKNTMRRRRQCLNVECKRRITTSEVLNDYHTMLVDMAEGVNQLEIALAKIRQKFIKRLERNPMSSKEHEVVLLVEAITEAAIGIAPTRTIHGVKAPKPKKLIWLPLSQISMQVEDYRVGDHVKVVVPEWLLVKKGLEWMVDE